MSINYTAIGERIRDKRTAIGLTQARLVELSGIEPSNISHIERGATKVSLPTLIAIANALDATLDELAYGNLIRSAHVTFAMIDDVLADCSDAEKRALCEILRTAKSAMRSLK
ncbi:MAG: helix-turn-helix transcriptional regulator [Clostridia bacterium]|nr:helix-turn-helix transcriptional regulator [Clostridia bacterium]